MVFLDAVEHDGPRPIKNKYKTVDTEKPDFGVEFESGVIIPDSARFVDTSRGPTTFMRQYRILSMRDLAMALRDPALYYMQFFLILIFGFLVGAAFFMTKYNVGDKVTNVPAGIVWIIFMMSYVQVFKVRSPRPSFLPFLTYLSSPQLALLCLAFPTSTCHTLPCLAFHFIAIRHVDRSPHPHPLYHPTTTATYRSII